jgi:hypothetical protein
MQAHESEGVFRHVKYSNDENFSSKSTPRFIQPQSAHSLSQRISPLSPPDSFMDEHISLSFLEQASRPLSSAFEDSLQEAAKANADAATLRNGGMQSTSTVTSTGGS